MKKCFLIVLVLCTVVISSPCVAGIAFEEPQQIQPRIIDKNSPYVFDQEFLPALQVKDSLVFLNSEIIELTANLRLNESFVKNGVKYEKDTFIAVKKTIEPLTEALATEVRRNSFGQIIEIKINLKTKDGENYVLSFFGLEDGWYILSGSGAYYEFRGKKYKLTVSTKGSCVLLVRPPVKSSIFYLR